MTARQAQVTDEYGNPVPGATVYVTDTLTLGYANLTLDGSVPLSQPIKTDEFGIYTYFANDGFYREDIWYSGKLRYREMVAVGLPPQFKGDPGGNVLAIGLFVAGYSLTIPVGTDIVRTSGFSVRGIGIADYVYDVAVDAAYVTAHPRTAFVSSNGRGYKLVKLTEDAAAFGALGDGVTDDTIALNTAAAAGRLRLGAGTYLLSQLVIPEGVFVETAGADTILRQKSGLAVGTVLVSLKGSNSGIGSFKGIGNIATDTSEFQNIVQVTCDATTGSLSNIRIGDIVGQDVRGDVVLVNQSAAAYAAGFRLTGVDIGFISGDNIYRNGVSIVGGSQVRVAGVNCTRVGLYSLDIEPDAGCGPGFGYDIGPIKGHWVAAVAPNVADCLDGVTFHSLDLNPAFATNSVPAYPAATRYGALTTRNAKSVSVGSLYAEGHPGPAYKPVYNVGELTNQAIHIASLDMKNMCTDVAETAWCWGQGDAVKITIDHVNVDMGASVNEAVFRGINLGRIGAVEAKGTGGYQLIYGCGDLEVGPVKVAAQAGNILVKSSDRVRINGGSFSGDYVFSFSNDCQVHGMAVTATTAVDTGGNRNWLFGGSVGGTGIGFQLYTTGAILLSADAAGVINAPSFQVGGNRVVAARGSAVANAANAAAAPTQAEFNALVGTVNTLISRFRATGGSGAIND